MTANSRCIRGKTRPTRSSSIPSKSFVFPTISASVAGMNRRELLESYRVPSCRLETPRSGGEHARSANFATCVINATSPPPHSSYLHIFIFPAGLPKSHASWNDHDDPNFLPSRSTSWLGRQGRTVLSRRSSEQSQSEVSPASHRTANRLSRTLCISRQGKLQSQIARPCAMV